MPGLSQGSAAHNSVTTNQETPTLTHELRTMPIVDSMWGWINNAKNTPVVGMGLQIAGWSFRVVAQQINNCCADKVKAVDELAGGYMVAFKDHYPILREPTSDVVDHVVDKASRMGRTSARTVLHSYPGQTIMEGLDGVIAASSYILKKVQPTTKSKKRSSPRKSTTRFSYNSENGKSDSKNISTESNKSTQTPKKDGDDQKAVTPGILKKLQPTETNPRTVMGYAYKLVVVSPVKLTVKSLLRLRNLLLELDGNKSNFSKATGMSPENSTEIESRRKISPRKRITNTFFGRVRTTARRFLGLGSKAISLTQADIRSYFSCDPNHKNDAERKRKYDDIQTDPDSDVSLTDFDLDQYRSDDDPDYEVPSGHSTDSMEYEAGHTESGNSTDSNEYEAGYTESDISIDDQGKSSQIKDSKDPSVPPVADNKPANKNKPNQNTIPKINGTDSKPGTNGNREAKSTDKQHSQPGKATDSKSTTYGKSETPKSTSDKSQPLEKTTKENIPLKTGTAS